MSRVFNFIFCAFFMLSMRDIFLGSGHAKQQQQQPPQEAARAGDRLPDPLSAEMDDLKHHGQFDHDDLSDQHRSHASVEEDELVEQFDRPIKKEIPSTRLNAIPTGNTLTIRYCYSCGYKKAFEEYSKALLAQNAGFVVNGENYQPTGARLYLAQFISLGKFAFMVIVLTGFWPALLDQLIAASIKAWIFNHKLYACLMAFFLSNTLESSLLASGAFEIFYNGKRSPAGLG